MSDNSQAYGLLAEFTTPADAMHAAEKIRDAGYSRWEAYVKCCLEIRPLRQRPRLIICKGL